MESKKKAILEEVEDTPDEQIRKAVGKKIREERDLRDQSAERIGNKIGISRVALIHIEKGRNNINAVQLWKLACIFGCEPSDFFPPIPEGFALTRYDYAKIAREDEKAESWARELFSDEFLNHDK